MDCLFEFLDNNNNKKRENCKKQEDFKEEDDNRQQQKTFLNICRNKASNSDSKRAFNCILKTGFLIRDMRRALDVLLEVAALAVLLLQDIMSTKCDD